MDFAELSKTKAGEFARLAELKQRRREGLFLAEGRKCVGDMMPKFGLHALILGPEAGEEELQLVQGQQGRVYRASAIQMKQVSTLVTPPSVIAVFMMPSVIMPVRKLQPNLYLMLDGVQDPGNLGTIIRIADWYGIPTIFLTGGCADCYNPKCVQATMGALGRVAIRHESAEAVVGANPGLPLIGTLLEGENIYSVPLPEAAILVMGSEGQGISGEVRALLDRAVTIPAWPRQGGCSESLNVAVATAIAVSAFRGPALAAPSIK